MSTPSDATSFVEDYLSTRKEKIAARNDAVAALDAAEYINTSKTPDQLPSIYAADPAHAPENKTPATGNPFFLRDGQLNMPLTTQLKGGRIAATGMTKPDYVAGLKSDYVNYVEQNWAELRGRIPVEWLLQWNPEDLKLMQGFGGVETDLVDQLIQQQHDMAVINAAEIKRQQDAQMQHDMQVRNRTFWKNVATATKFTLGIGVAQSTGAVARAQKVEDVSVIKERLDQMAAGVYDTNFSKDITDWKTKTLNQNIVRLKVVRDQAKFDQETSQMQAAAGEIPDPVINEDYANLSDAQIEAEAKRQLADQERELRAQINYGVDPHTVFGNGDPLYELSKGGMWLMGQGLQLASKLAGGAIEMSMAPLANLPGGGPLGWLQQHYKDKMNETVAVMQQEIGQPNYDKATNIQDQQLNQMWLNEQATNTQNYQELMSMAGGNPALAFSFFAADVRELPAAKQQLAQYVNEMDANTNALIRQAQESDFRMSAALMQGMAWYGHQVGYLATGVALLASSQDAWAAFQDSGVKGLFKDLYTEAKLYDATPSKALGIDGSMLGLLTDIGLTTVLDPTVWFFGPRFGKMAEGVSTAEEAARVASGPVMKRMMLDVKNWALSPAKGAGALHKMIDWLPDVAQGRLLKLMGFKPQVLFAEPWRDLPGAANAMEVPLEFLQKMSRGPGTDITAKGLAKLQNEILADGFKEWGTIETSRLTGRSMLVDGNKRLAAAALDDRIGTMPVVQKIVDSLPGEIPETADNFIVQVAKGEAGAATHTMDSSRTLKAALEDGDNFMAQARGEQVKPVTGEKYTTKITKTKTVKLADGEEITLNVGAWDLSEGGGAAGVALDSNGNVIAYAGTNGKKLGGVIGRRGPKGTMTELMDLLEQEFPGSFQHIASDSSISIDAGRFNQQYAQRLLDRQVNTLDMPTLADLGVIPDMIDFAHNGPLQAFGAGEKTIRPDKLFSPESLYGQMPMDEIHQLLTDAIQSGAKPNLGRDTIITRALNNHLRESIRRLPAGEWINRYTTKVFTQTQYTLGESGSVARLMKMAHSIWGDDSSKLNYWIEQYFAYQMKAAEKVQLAVERVQALKPLKDQIEYMRDNFGSAWDNEIQAMKIMQKESSIGSPAELQTAMANRAQVRAYMSDLEAEYSRQFLEYQKMSQGLSTTQDLADITMAMIDDYKATYIDSADIWAPELKLIDGKMQVPYEVLNKGPRKRLMEGARASEETTKNVFAQSMVEDVAKELGLEPGAAEKLVNTLSETRNQPMSLTLPVDPLTLVMARATGGAAFTRLSHFALLGKLRDAAFTINAMWVIDKVFRMSTAVTVSFDELLRIWHLGGFRAFKRWAEDRALYNTARAEALLREGAIKNGVERGVKYMSQAAQDRVRVLKDFPTYLKQAERQFYDGNGLGWIDINPGDPGYLDAAQRWMGGFLQDSGFRAYLKGPDAFREWFMGPDGSRLRDAAILHKDTTGNWSTILESGAENYYQGWNTLFEDIILNEAKKAGNADAVRQAIKDAAVRIEESGGHASELPGFVFENLGAVRGVRKELPTKAGITAISDKFFENLFMKPVNYRRGFLADLVRTSEKNRIERLFASQGKRIVSDAEIEQTLNLQGLSGASRVGAKQAIQDAALNHGMVAQSMIDDIVERMVESELDNVLFTWDQATRAGSQARAVFPFGRPWADMMGFWGRELLRRPVLRGVVNDSNMFWLRSLNERGLIPFNPKTFGLVSRMANTDFTINHGWTGGAFGTPRVNAGLTPGSSQSDFSPLFFLPTGGDNPFASLIPGLGILPMWALDLYLGKIDPVTDPLRYQQTLDQIGDFLPSVKYQQGGFLSRMVGGGTSATLAEATVDGLGLYSAAFLKDGTESYYNFTSQLGDITREVNVTRQVSAILADPEELKMLTDAVASGADIETMLAALAKEADNRASGQNLAKLGARWVVPMTSKYDTSISDIMDVWLTAMDKFPELNVRPSLKNVDMTDEENRRQVANDVRKSFFDLPQWKRDLLVSQYPQLAVNLVSSWEWTPAAVAANLPGTDKSYRTGGTTSDTITHQYYINRGYIRPLQALERARRIVGMMFAAKENAAKQTYTFAAKQINAAVWDYVVSDKTKELLQKIVDSDFAKKYDVRSIEELWANWGTLESKFEEWDAQALGIDPESDTYQRLKELVNIPQKEKAWGETWPGVNPDQVSGKFGGVTFKSFSQDLQDSADGLGIDLTPGMTGEQLYNELQSRVTEVTNPLYSTVRTAYDTYVSVRSQPAESALKDLQNAANNQSLDKGWRDALNQFMYNADSVKERYATTIGGIPYSEQQKIVDAYRFLYQSSDLPLNWEKIWQNRYERTFGPLTWLAPEPVKPVTDSGQLVDGAYTPNIIHLQDGDSMVVRLNPNSNELTGVRLLGVRARDYGSDPEGAQIDAARLQNAVRQAVLDGVTIYLVRDPGTFGSNTDHYGRVLAWLWFGDKPFYFPEDFRRNQTESGKVSQ